MRLGAFRGVVAFAVAIATVLCLTTSAGADEHTPAPTKAQVDHAKAVAAKKAGDVASLQARLAVANSQLHDAAEKAEVASEAYNGAMFRLSQARAETAKAKAEAAAAAAHVEEQRAGIASLVTQSYQDGSSLANMTAFLGADGVESVMGRIGAVQSAADSMQAKYDEFTALGAMARVARAKAEKAEKAQEKLAKKAAALRDAAAEAADEAQSRASVIAGERTQLIKELAAAQKISVGLAVRRQQSLEQIAQQKAAAAAAKAAAEKARHDAEQQAQDKDQTDHELENLPEEGGWELPGLAAPRGTAAGGLKAVQYAKAQLGDMYLWAADGPDRWDCSGLTMMAWKSAGVSLVHYSAAQYQQTMHLNVGNLRPGDLVFWGTSPNTIHHVAMYVGNGQIIHAPRTGEPVQINSMYYWIPPNFFGRP
jgi:cell wall-associated NlpC family hydrolase